MDQEIIVAGLALVGSLSGILASSVFVGGALTG